MTQHRKRPASKITVNVTFAPPSRPVSESEEIHKILKQTILFFLEKKQTIYLEKKIKFFLDYKSEC